MYIANTYRSNSFFFFEKEEQQLRIKKKKKYCYFTSLLIVLALKETLRNTRKLMYATYTVVKKM